MYSKILFPALAAIPAVAAATTGSICTVSTTTINSQAEATALSSCSSVEGSVVISTSASNQIDISGPTTITGDLTIQDNGGLITLASTTLQTITGTFLINNVTALQSLSMSAINSVGTITWQSAPQLQTLNFGTTGITTAKAVTISDTFLNSLTGIDLTTVATMDINNNNRLADINIQLSNLTDILRIQANGANLQVTLPNLIWAANLTIANVTDFSAPSLQVVNGSLNFDSNYFTSFSAPNLTSTSSGDISFVDNAYMGNMSFPALTTLGGGLLVANNTALSAIDGFPLLKQVAGAIKLRGNFTDIEFPSLNVVKGAFDASSTGNIDSSCQTLSKLAPTNQGGNNDVQGVFACTSNNSTANSDTGGGTSSTGSTSGSGSSSSSSGKTNSSAYSIHVNYAMLGLAGAAGFAQALW